MAAASLRSLGYAVPGEHATPDLAADLAEMETLLAKCSRPKVKGLLEERCAELRSELSLAEEAPSPPLPALRPNQFVHEPMRPGDTILIDAVRHGRADEVAMLLASCDANEPKTDGSGATALHVACQEGHREIAAALLAADAAVNPAKDDGATPLFVACQHGYAELTAALLAAGAAVDQAKDDGATPLFMACQKGHTEIAAALIAGGAAVHQATDAGATPLFVACEKGHAETAAALIAAGAEVNHRAGHGVTPLYIACQEGHTVTAAALLAAGAALNQAAEDGATPLFAACTHGHTETAAALLAAGAAADQAADGGATALFIACQQGHTETAAALLAAGAKVDEAKNGCVTPLYIACRHGRLSAVQLLSSYDASRIFAVNGMTAEGMAAYAGFDAVREWLEGSQQWTTPLHHLATIGTDRVRALLRGGAALHAKVAGADGDAPTPLSLAERLCAEGSAPPDSARAAYLVLRAAEPWSPQTHHLLPSAARARAVELMLLGVQLSHEARFEKEDDPGAGHAVLDVWMAYVMPHAVQRADYEVDVGGGLRL